MHIILYYYHVITSCTGTLQIRRRHPFTAYGRSLLCPCLHLNLIVLFLIIIKNENKREAGRTMSVYNCFGLIYHR